MPTFANCCWTLGAIEETEEQLQCLVETYKARTMDGVHDLLLRLGDLRRDELLARCASPEVALTVERLRKAGRLLEVAIATEKRLIAVEDAGRYRDALGVALPQGLPKAFQTAVPDAAVDLIRRFARTHGPCLRRTFDVAMRFGFAVETAEAVLIRLVQTGRVVEGGFRPGGVHREWCEVEVLRSCAAEVAGEAAQGSGAGPAGGAGAVVYALAGRGAAAAGARCSAGCD